jgi:hypothetical protein
MLQDRSFPGLLNGILEILIHPPQSAKTAGGDFIADHSEPSPETEAGCDKPDDACCGIGPGFANTM